MPRHDNHKIVRDFLDLHPNGATAQQIQTAFSHKVTLSKVLIPMITNGEIILTGGLYKNNPSYVPPVITRTVTPRRATTTGRTTKPVICYPDPIPSNPDFNVFRHQPGTKVDCRGFIVLLTRENAAKVENLIQTDPDYPQLALAKYEDFCRKDGHGNAIRKSFDFINPDALEQVLLQIDIDNSTKDVAISTGRPATANSTFCAYIRDPANHFLDELDSANPNVIKNLVDKLRRAHPYYNPKSFASKACKYLHEFYYGNDRFFINDKVVRSMLGYYLDFYGVSHVAPAPAIDTKQRRDLDYKDLYDYLEKLREAAKVKHGHYIKRSELDHILWYCYKCYKNKEL